MCPDEKSGSAFEDMLPSVGYKSLNGLTLAFIGDAVYELMIRQYVLSQGEAKIKTLHKDCVDYVNADFQADAMDRLSGILTDEEYAVYKRGRNAKAGHTPKNKSEIQYHKSTGFEALMGYVYLKRDFDRLKYLFSLTVNQGEGNGKERE